MRVSRGSLGSRVVSAMPSGESKQSDVTITTLGVRALRSTSMPSCSPAHRLVAESGLRVSLRSRASFLPCARVILSKKKKKKTHV